MKNVTTILNKQMEDSLDRIRDLLDKVTEACNDAARIYEMSPDAAEELLVLIGNEVERFQLDFYDIIIQKCINQVRINYTQGKLFDD